MLWQKVVGVVKPRKELKKFLNGWIDCTKEEILRSSLILSR
jgi:hypothetical protein